MCSFLFFNYCFCRPLAHQCSLRPVALLWLFVERLHLGFNFPFFFIPFIMYVLLKILLSFLLTLKKNVFSNFTCQAQKYFCAQHNHIMYNQIWKCFQIKESLADEILINISSQEQCQIYWTIKWPQSKGKWNEKALWESLVPWKCYIKTVTKVLYPFKWINWL